jgi:glycosyltransferase involved in cell wall biosynthesis
VLGNGVETSFWRRSNGKRTADEVHFVSAMRMSRKKRPLELVRAFASAHRFVAGSPTLRLTIAGDGPDRDAAARLASELGVGAFVRLPGHLSREDLRELYGRADVFVLPSERESFGIAALEARAAGLPVIAMLASGARDFIAPGVNGLLASDHTELARFISRMALEPAMREQCRRNNQLPPMDHDWSAVTDAHREIYRAAAMVRETPAAPSHA